MWVLTQSGTDQTIYFFVKDSTTGAAKTGLAYNSAGAAAYYIRPLAAPVAITLATQTPTGAHADGGFVEVSAANAPGLYRLDLPDAVISASGGSVIVVLGFTGALVEPALISLAVTPDLIVGTVVVDAGNSASSFKTNLPATETDHYKDQWALFRTGVLTGQAHKVTAFNPTTDILSTGAYSATPTTGDEFVLINQ